MRKKYLLIIVTLMGILSLGIMVFRNRPSVISSVEAEKVLQNYLIDFSQWEDDYVLEPLNPAAGEIGRDKVYRFEVRYKDTVEEAGGRLVSNYAVSADGEMIFQYDLANDEWMIQK